MTEELQEFAKLLIDVRDSSIKDCDKMFTDKSKGPSALRWQDAKLNDKEKLPEMMIADCVDTALANLLLAIDQGLLNITFKSSSDKEINLTENGELTGWFMGSDGWRAQYSKERYIDDFKDLA